MEKEDTERIIADQRKRILDLEERLVQQQRGYDCALRDERQRFQIEMARLVANSRKLHDQTREYSPRTDEPVLKLAIPDKAPVPTHQLIARIESSKRAEMKLMQEQVTPRALRVFSLLLGTHEIYSLISF